MKSLRGNKKLQGKISNNVKCAPKFKRHEILQFNKIGRSLFYYRALGPHQNSSANLNDSTFFPLKGLDRFMAGCNDIRLGGSWLFKHEELNYYARHQ